jgi:hypothetical protein
VNHFADARFVAARLSDERVGELPVGRFLATRATLLFESLHLDEPKPHGVVVGDRFEAGLLPDQRTSRALPKRLHCRVL